MGYFRKTIYFLIIFFSLYFISAFMQQGASFAEPRVIEYDGRTIYSAKFYEDEVRKGGMTFGGFELGYLDCYVKDSVTEMPIQGVKVIYKSEVYDYFEDFAYTDDEGYCRLQVAYDNTSTGEGYPGSRAKLKAISNDYESFNTIFEYGYFFWSQRNKFGLEVKEVYGGRNPSVVEVIIYMKPVKIQSQVIHRKEVKQDKYVEEVKDNICGTWEISCNNYDGQLNIDYLDENNFEGEMYLYIKSSEVSKVYGKIYGDKIEFKRMHSANDSMVDQLFEGTFDGNSIRGRFGNRDGSMKWSWRGYRD